MSIFKIMSLACILKKADKLNYATLYILLFSNWAAVSLNLFFFVGGENEFVAREINSNSSVAQSGFLSGYLQPSKPRVFLCFRGLSRAVPNPPARLSRILKTFSPRPSEKFSSKQ